MHNPGYCPCMFGPKARRGRWALGILLLALSAPLPGHAQVPVSPPPTGDAPETAARQHFDRALELYRAGKYRSARDELKAAAELDPNGKDLFFNLALVEEKLGDLPAAIAALQRFRSLEEDARERARAGVTIERLRGAQAASSGAAASAPCPEPKPVRGPDPVLIGSASLGAVSLVVAAVFGVKALSDDVADERTSTSLPVAKLRERARRAEREALVADVALALAAASAGTFVCVWLLSPGDPAPRAGVSVGGRF
jgi:tetratricopeptide (TPR) repeat protein